MIRRFLLNLPVPKVGEMFAYHGSNSAGKRIDCPATVFRVAELPSKDNTNGAILDMLVFTPQGMAFVEGVEYGEGQWCYSKPKPIEPVQIVVEVPEGDDPPDMPDGPEWYRKMIGLK